MKKTYFTIYLVIITMAVAGYSVWKYQDAKRGKNAIAVEQSASSPTDKLIFTYQNKLQNNPNNVRDKLQLASAYIQKSRETGDTAYYNKVDSLMDSAQASEPKNAEVYALRGIIELARHHFINGLELGNKAVAINPNKALYYGIIADAQTELGKNDDAVNTLQTMVDKRPDYSSFSRIAYARELHGDIEGARAAIQTAVQEGSSFGENTAWGYVELGKLDMRSDLNKAQEQFNLALTIVPNYSSAFEQLGKVAYAKGYTKAAIDNFQKALNALPLAQYAIDLGEVYEQAHDTAKASQYYSLAQTAFSKAASGGVNTDMELSLLLSEHDLDVTRALSLAKQSYLVRGSIYGADALAWAYYKNNQADKAQEYIVEALRLGQNDPGIVFHAGIIAEKNGKADIAKNYFKKAVALNPQFSILYSKIASTKANE